MKITDFPCRENGYITPQAVGAYLIKHGHLEGIIDNRRYITYDGVGYQVISVADKIVQIIEMPISDCQRIGHCSNLKFGDF